MISLLQVITTECVSTKFTEFYSKREPIMPTRKETLIDTFSLRTLQSRLGLEQEMRREWKSGELREVRQSRFRLN